MRANERRLAALEARLGSDELRAIFITWCKPDEPENQRRMVDRDGVRYLQEPGETEDAFFARIKAVVEGDPPKNSPVAFVFVHHVSWNDGED